MNFELIYRIDSEHFFIPMLCDDNEPEKMDIIDSEEAFHVSYEYTYLPDNVLHLLMVRHGYELNTDIVWRTGAVFEREQCGWIALVRIKDNCLDIYAKSDNPKIHPVNSYLTMMRESINKVNDKLGFDAKEFIAYRKDGLEDRFKYGKLLGSKKAGIDAIYSEVFDAPINIDEILGIINSSEKPVEYDLDNQIEELLNSLMDALLKLQNNSTYYDAKEDACNSYIRDMLDGKGYTCKDQTLGGISKSGKSDGERDIVIQDKDRSTDLTVYEALKLSSFNRSDQKYLLDHLTKLLDNYNPKGFRNLFLVSYVSWSKDKFDEFAKDYYDYVLSSNVKSNISDTVFNVANSREMNSYTSNSIFSRCLRIGYRCGDTIMYVYHIIIRVA